jgi:hypothetical protein
MFSKQPDKSELEDSIKTLFFELEDSRGPIKNIQEYINGKRKEFISYQEQCDFDISKETYINLMKISWYLGGTVIALNDEYFSEYPVMWSSHHNIDTTDYTWD